MPVFPEFLDRNLRVSLSINSYISGLAEAKSAISQTGGKKNYCGYFTRLPVPQNCVSSLSHAPSCSDTKWPLAGTFQAGCVPEERFPCWTACVTFLPLCWHLLNLKTSGQKGRSKVCLLVGFSLHIPMSWVSAGTSSLMQPDTHN